MFERAGLIKFVAQSDLVVGEHRPGRLLACDGLEDLRMLTTLNFLRMSCLSGLG
jgi:hypothetical protein